MGYPCPNCSADNDESARFCRKCGARIYPEDVHEASTRNLEPHAAGTDPVPGRVTGRVERPETAAPPSGFGVAPNYVPPGGPMAPQYPGAPVPHKGRNWGMILLSVFAAVVLLCGVGGAFIYSMVQSAAEKIEASKGHPITVSTGDDGEVIVQNPLGGDVSPDALPEDMQDWWYPGATIQQFIQENQGGRKHRVLIMSTEDGVREVVDHYREQIGEGAEINEVIANGHEVGSLSKDDTNIAITKAGPREAGTQIVVDLGGDGRGGAHGPAGPIPVPPVPPAGRPGATPPGAVPAPPAPPPAPPK